MNAQELQDYLHTRIPLSRAMAIEVRSADPRLVQIHAPLAPNINHRDTVFGGSASAVAILAAWSAIHVRMRAEGLTGRIVIRSNSMDYERPITAGFTATAGPPDALLWSRFVAALAKKRMARVRIEASLECAGMRVGQFKGEFVVLPDAG